MNAVKNASKILSFFSQFKRCPESEGLPAKDIGDCASAQQGVLASGISAGVGIKYSLKRGLIEQHDFVLKRVLKNKDDIYFNVFSEEVPTQRLLNLSSIIEIKDRVNKVIYRNPYRYLEKSLGIELQNTPENYSQFSHAINRTRPGVTALAYLADSDGDRAPEEREIIVDYVRKKCPDLKYDDQEVRDYLARLVPDEESFYEAMVLMLAKENWEIKFFMETVIRLILSDGYTHPNEKEFLNELVSIFQSEGIELSIGA